MPHERHAAASKRLETLARCWRLCHDGGMGNRRFLKLHLGTWLALFVALAALLDCQLKQRRPYWAHLGYQSVGREIESYYGWPFVYLELWQAVDYGRLPEIHLIDTDRFTSRAGLAVNLVISAAALFAVAVLSERWNRAGRRLQFSLSSLLSLVAISGVLLALYSLETRLAKSAGLLNTPFDGGLSRHGQVADPAPFAYPIVGDFSWPMRMALVFIIGCTIYLAGECVVKGAVCVCRFVCRGRTILPRGMS